MDICFFVVAAAYVTEMSRMYVCYRGMNAFAPNLSRSPNEAVGSLT